MKVTIQATNLNIQVTTDCGGEIYSYQAEQTSTMIDVLALLDSSADIGAAVVKAIADAEKMAKSAKQQD